nr:ABC transporter permease [Cyclobacteriaceae bacterium]
MAVMLTFVFLFSMLKQYGTAILRHLIRQRSFTVVIVAGLTIGITASLVLVLYIQDELRYDRFFPDAERMYRITFEGKIKNTTVDAAKVGFPIGESIKKNFKEVEDYCRLASWNSFPVRFENMASTEAYMLLADPQFFTFFNIQLVEGNPAEALRGKHKLVLSQSAAKRIFNYNSPQDASPIGKVLQLAQGYEATVTGIAEDMPSHSHFHFSMILSLESWEQADRSAWISQEVYTYVKFLPIVNEQETIPLILKFTQQQLQEEVKKYKATFSSLASRGNYIQYQFQPLTAIHLHSSLPDEIEAEGDIRQIILFACIATFILVLACINFVNLSTARATSRAKEVGIRKVLGAENNTIVFHFLLESYVYTGLALLFALVLVAASIVPMNVLTDKRITIEAFGQPVFIGTILLFLVFTGLFSGGYPAFFLARLGLVDILKGYLTKGITTYTIRNFLVSFQFGVSIALLIACWIMASQIVLLKQNETKLPDAHCLRLYHTANIGNADSIFKQQVLTLPGIKSF